MATLDLQAIRMDDEDLKETEGTTWKHIKCLPLMSTKNIQKPIFLCNPKRRHLTSSFHDALQTLATRRTIQLKTIFLHTETETKKNVAWILEALSDGCSYSFCLDKDFFVNNPETVQHCLLKIQRNEKTQ